MYGTNHKKNVGVKSEKGKSQESFTIKEDKTKHKQSYPEDDLQVRGGVVAAIKSRLRLSDQACTILRGHFSHLLIGNDKSRFMLGGEQGHQNHPHALGAFLRSYYDNLIMYKYAPRGSCLDVGGSTVRTLSRYQNGRPWLDRVHLQTPCLDVRDDIRLMDTDSRIDRLIEEYNKRLVDVEDGKIMHRGMEGVVYEDIDGNTQVKQCGCMMNVTSYPQSVCECNGQFEFVKSVESWYYDGVMEGTVQKICNQYLDCPRRGVAYVVGSDYYRMMLRQVRDEKSDLYQTLKKSFTSQDYKINTKGFGCKNTDDEPESENIIESIGRDLYVEAVLKGNPMPYYHKFMRTADEDVFAYKYTYLDHKFLILVEKLEEIKNGDIPFCLYKLRVTEENRWRPELLRRVKVLDLSFATVDNFYQDITVEVIDRLTKDMNTEIKVAPKDKEVEVPVDLFNADVYEKKVISSEKRIYPQEQRVVVESNCAFVRWMKRQIGDRNLTHHFAMKIVDKRMYLVVRKFIRSFLGLNVTVSENMSAMAPVEDVVKAYLAIGVKSNVTAVQQCLVQNQRDIDNPNYKMFADQDAYIIARLLRSIETKRFEDLVA